MTKRDDKMIEEISAATSAQRMNSLNSRRLAKAILEDTHFIAAKVSATGRLLTLIKPMPG
jgi:hypothetical protein